MVPIIYRPLNTSNYKPVIELSQLNTSAPPPKMLYVGLISQEAWTDTFHNKIIWSTFLIKKYLKNVMYKKTII